MDVENAGQTSAAREGRDGSANRTFFSLGAPIRDRSFARPLRPLPVLGFSALSSLLLLAAGARGSSGDPAPSLRLVDVAAEAGVKLLNVCGGKQKDFILEADGNGAAFLDYDNDGDLDLFIVNGSTLEHFKRGGDRLAFLYRNGGDGRFSDVSRAAGLSQTGWGMGVCAGDYDNDGFQDLYVTAFGPNLLLHNSGDGTFSDATESAGVGDTRWSTGCAFGDYDRDGELDLYVANFLRFDGTIPARGESSTCNYMGIEVFCGPLLLTGQPDALYRNRGDGSFEDATRAAGITDPDSYGFGVLFTDLDNDGWLDIYVANDSMPNLLFMNQRDGHFTEVGLSAGVALSEDARAQAGMGAAAGDFNNDGSLDLLVTNFSEDSNTLYVNYGQRMFLDGTTPGRLKASSMPYLGWGAGFVDLDNDGFLDLFIANGHVYPQVEGSSLNTRYLQPNQVYRNRGDETFEEVNALAGAGSQTPKSSRGAAFGDYDNDGDIDVLVTNLNDRPTLLQNQTPPVHHWLTLRLIGRQSNRDAIGSRVSIRTKHGMQVREVRSGGSYLSHNDLRVHFGLGSADRVEELRVRWPLGRVQTFQDLPLNQFLVITEGKNNVLPAGRR